MNKLKVSLAAALGSFLLAGCGQLGPGVAAEVGGTKIRTSDVELLTKAQCSDAKAAGQMQPIATLQSQSLNALLDAELSNKFTAEHGSSSYDPDLLRSAMKSYDDKVISKLPAADRERTTELFELFTKSQFKMLNLGRSMLGGGSQVTEQAALEAAYRARTKFDPTQDIEVDPEFRPSKSGVAGGGDGSMSVPVSDYAKKATAKQPDPDWVGALPLNQKCG